MSDPKWDVVVVGSGAGGAAAAYGLTQRGLSVLLLEAGPHFDPATDYGQTDPKWEAREFPEKPGSRADVTMAPGQKLPVNEPLLVSFSRGGERDIPAGERLMAGYQHVRGVGGTTLHFSGEAHRLHPHAMTMKSRFGVGADWPIDYAGLEPYYVLAEEMVGVAGPATQGARWRSKPFPLPPHPLSYGAHARQRRRRPRHRMGGEQPRRPLRALSRPPALQSLRRLPDGLHARRQRQRRRHLRCRRPRERPLHAARQCAGGADRGRARRPHRRGGSLERIATPRLVLAAGAVETPRLLLASRNIANESGEVGRNFMETIAASVTALHPEPQHARRGLPDDAICWDFNAPDAIPGVVGGCRLYNASAEAGAMGLSTFAINAVPGWGRDHARRTRELWGHALSVAAIGESIPNTRARVDLDPDARDSFGKPLARITAWLTEMDVARLRFMAGKCRELLAACGATDIVDVSTTWDNFNATHVFGTCRMGTDPRHSVVDPDLRSHRWRNLWITDASVFPSSGGGEAPSLTIEALALRTAARIAS